MVRANHEAQPGDGVLVCDCGGGTVVRSNWLDCAQETHVAGYHDLSSGDG
jgi:hypothetical protein